VARNPPIYFAASFAGVPMLVSRIETERGRDIVVQSPAQGDVHSLSNQGKKLRRSTCDIRFVDQANQESYTDRYEAFLKLFEDGEAYVLSHPLDGEYVVRGGGLSVSSEAGSMSINVTAEFFHEQETPAVFPTTAGASTSAGLESVSTAVARADNVLAEFELESSVPAAALAEVTAWSEAEDLDSQAVFLGVASLTQQIDEDIATLGLTEDLALWEPYREMILLRYEIARAGAAFTSSAATVFDLFVEQPQPVLKICAEVYGAALAREMRDRVVKMNRLRTPGRVPAGTTLKMPSAEAL
jgi:hypothetical protein